MSYTWGAWQGADTCTGSVTTGARALLAWCLEAFPMGRSLGIYNCRTVRGGSTTSLHGEGRAVDYGMPLAPDGTGGAAGHRLLDRIGPHGKRLGIQAVIFDREIWSAKSPDGRYYGGVHPHYDHLHIELTWAAARALTLTTLRSVLGGPDEETDVYVITKGQGISSGVTGENGDPHVRYWMKRLDQMGYDLGEWGNDGKYGDHMAALVDDICEKAGLPKTGQQGLHINAALHFERRWALEFAGGGGAVDLSGYLKAADADVKYAPKHDHPYAPKHGHPYAPADHGHPDADVPEHQHERVIFT